MLQFVNSKLQNIVIAVMVYMQDQMNLAVLNVGGTLKPMAAADVANLDQGSMTVITRCDAGTQVLSGLHHQTILNVV